MTFDSEKSPRETSRGQRRILSLCIGTALALALAAAFLPSRIADVFSAVRFAGRRPEDVGTTELAITTTNAPCSENDNYLRVEKDDWQGRELKLEQRWSADNTSVSVTYSSGWAQSRVVELAIIGDCVNVHAWTRTCTGNWGCSVDPHRSRARRHERWLCFDFTLVTLNGSTVPERWQGAVALP
jgi:hypothetical protein